MEHDLALQAHALESVERDADVAERTRAERARVPFTDRLRGQLGSSVTFMTAGAGRVGGLVQDVGADHVALDGGPGRFAWVLCDAVLWVQELPFATDPPAGTVAARWSIAGVLRRLARDRTPMRLVLRDGSTLHGTAGAVGADHVDLAVHPVGLPARSGEVLRHVVVPVSAVAAVFVGPPWSLDH